MKPTNSGVVTVRTEEEFERALRAKCPYFVFEGPKAGEISRKIRETEDKRDGVRTVSILAGIACLIAAPFTAGSSLLGLGLTTGAVALSEPVILAIIAGVVAIATESIRALRDYKVRELDKERLEFTRK